ncbi:MAG: 4'-phosphopantetheinyl transferase superfamily protein [Xanthomonadales bacterium]|nr:4'-phosphopantetheinyl transferase superfamily protein [Gammaproteobacteria bacterium]MBT8054760.1 4'-phosphopantetheinyl transferase superfamily protein [Gammaproteobacteria bacterium]NND58553.1 4'-phosphopantetheinyl transferase superfamily protein [Xanthomonadales bacterium]NNK52247.1 4'-phosphopantetheinyl transferase superfamily protein [Xanthomonadales bacterium]
MVIGENESAIAADVQDFAPRAIPLTNLNLPPAGEIHLWFLDLSALAGSLRRALDGHDNGSVSLTTGQLRFARRFYLRLLLGAYLGLPGKEVKINRKQRGKPVLDASVHAVKLHFSMAKSGDRLLIGFSASSHIGVDLEPAQRAARNALGVARRYFSAAEAESLAAAPAEELSEAFLRVWACKEAVVKASGKGIANQFARFTVESNTLRPAAVLQFEGESANGWTLALVRPEPGFLGAVAVRDQVTDLSAFQLIASS